MKNQKKKKTKQYLDIDFINTSYGPLVIHNYKNRDKKDKKE